MKYLSLLLFVLLVTSLFSQDDSQPLTFSLRDSSSYRLLIQTMENSQGSETVIDNMKITWDGEDAKVFYNRYSDNVLSSMLIPFPITEQIVKFETDISNFRSEDPNSVYSIQITSGNNSIAIPIDAPNLGQLSNFMRLLEE